VFFPSSVQDILDMGLHAFAMSRFSGVWSGMKTIQEGVESSASVIVDPERKRVLWVGRGRSRADIRPFFELLGPRRCDAIQAVAMDMNSAFDLEVKAHCPNAEVVYDLFHVVAKYGREVIDRVRVDEANRLRQDAPARRIVKTSRWLLLRNRNSVPSHQVPRLDELLAANHALMTVYVMKDALKALWQCRHEDDARRRWQDWLSQAIQSGLPPLQAFARRLAPYVQGIVVNRPGFSGGCFR
jgi:transposase